MNGITFVLNRNPQLPFTAKLPRKTLAFSNLNYGRSKPLADKEYYDAARECNAAMAGQHFIQAVFAIEGTVRPVDVDTTLLGLKTFHSRSFVVLVEKFRFVGTESTASQVGRFVVEEIPDIVKGLATEYGGAK